MPDLDRIESRAALLRIGVVLAALLALATGSLQSLLCHEAGTAPWMVAIAGRFISSCARAESSPWPASSYFALGRWLALAYLALLARLLMAPPPERWPKVLPGLLGLGLLGHLASHGLGWAGQDLRRVAFWGMEIPALAMAILICTLWGASGLGSGKPGFRGWMVAALPLAVFATLLLRSFPHGALVAIAGSMVLSSVAYRPAIPRWEKVLLGFAGPLALLIAASGPMLAYRPVLIEGRTAIPAADLGERGLPGLRLHVFNTAFNRMAPLLVGTDAPWRPVAACVIEHPAHGLILFDTGISGTVARQGERAYPWPLRWLLESQPVAGGTLPDQMAAAGLEPRRVSLVVLSHLHEDHTGTALCFPHARILAGPGAREHAAQPLQARLEELPRAPPEGWLDLLGDGSYLTLHVGGHAAEELIALVQLPGGPVLLAGDAVVHHDWFRSRDVQRIPADPQRAADIRDGLRQWRRRSPRLLIIPGHDLDGLPQGRTDLVLHGADGFAHGSNAIPLMERCPPR